MRFRPAGGLDLATGALILGGAGFLACAIAAVAVLIAPPQSAAPSVEQAPTPRVASKAAAALPPDRVATVLTVDLGNGGGGAVRAGDHIDVTGYFASQVTGSGAVTRVLAQDVPVLAVDRSDPRVALTLAVPQESALLLQEAQALGARAFVMLRPVNHPPDLPSSFSDQDLARRLSRSQ